MVRPGSWSRPAGGSPVRVIAGEPGSRPRWVRANRGAAGVDRMTLAYVREEYGVARMLGELQADLRAGVYRPAPARRVDIPKPEKIIGKPCAGNRTYGLKGGWGKRAFTGTRP